MHFALIAILLLAQAPRHGEPAHGPVQEQKPAPVPESDKPRATEHGVTLGRQEAAPGAHGARQHPREHGGDAKEEGGVAEDISWPGALDKFVNLRVAGIQYSLTRLVILGIGLAVGGAAANPGAVTVDFLPHLIPMTRGILSAGYVRPTRSVTQGELDALYSDAYANEPFVRVVGSPPATKHVLGSNFARVHVRLDGRSPMLDLLAEGLEFSLKFVQPAHVRFSVRQREGRLTGSFWDQGTAQPWSERGPGGAAVGAGTILEVAIPLSDLGLSPGDPVAFSGWCPVEPLMCPGMKLGSDLAGSAR